MRWLNRLRQWCADPVRLSPKEKTLSIMACCAAIGLTAAVTQAVFPGQGPLLVASMGASVVILFAMPASPLAQPWPFAGGQCLSATAGVMAATHVDHPVWAPVLAVGLAVLAMLVFRCLHPPGAATALAPVVAHGANEPVNVGFLLMPVAVNVATMLVLAWLINRWVLHRQYPALAKPFARPVTTEPSVATRFVTIDMADIEQTLQSFDRILDIGSADVYRIYLRLQQLAFERRQGAVTCADVMVKDIVTVAYDTEVESAWMLMHRHNLKALPVLDDRRRVIGIVTRQDFLKNLKLTPYQSFQEKWVAFVKRTPNVSTDKPEVVGHVMTRQVKTLPMAAHAVTAIPLVVDEGHHHIPVVDGERRFVGMIFQSRLLSALFVDKASATFKK